MIKIEQQKVRVVLFNRIYNGSCGLRKATVRDSPTLPRLISFPQLQDQRETFVHRAMQQALNFITLSISTNIKTSMSKTHKTKGAAQTAPCMSSGETRCPASCSPNSWRISGRTSSADSLSHHADEHHCGVLRGFESSLARASLRYPNATILFNTARALLGSLRSLVAPADPGGNQFFQWQFIIAYIKGFCSPFLHFGRCTLHKIK